MAFWKVWVYGTKKNTINNNCVLFLELVLKSQCLWLHFISFNLYQSKIGMISKFIDAKKMYEHTAFLAVGQRHRHRSAPVGTGLHRGLPVPAPVGTGDYSYRYRHLPAQTGPDRTGPAQDRTGPAQDRHRPAWVVLWRLWYSFCIE